MKWFRITAAAMCLAAGLPLSAMAQTNTATTSKCPICDCNDQVGLCRINCQSSGDYIGVQQCNITCTKTYSTCIDTAYQTMRVQQQIVLQQQQTSTNTTASTAVGTSQTVGTATLPSTAAGGS